MISQGILKSTKDDTQIREAFHFFLGEGGKIWENGIETCKISCMK